MLRVAVQRLSHDGQKVQLHQDRVKLLGSTSWMEVLNLIPDWQCLINFRVCRTHTHKFVTALGWSNNALRTERNGYKINDVLTKLVVLRRIASPCRWGDTESLFGKHGSQLS